MNLHQAVHHTRIILVFPKSMQLEHPLTFRKK